MYQKMYTVLFNAITDALKFAAEGDTKTYTWILEEAQRETENIYMEWDWEHKPEPEEGPEDNPENDPSPS